MKKEEIEKLKTKYLGKKIKLIWMSDPNPIPPQMTGTVDRIDDLGTLFVKWDNGRLLGVIPNIDIFNLVH